MSLTCPRCDWPLRDTRGISVDLDHNILSAGEWEVTLPMALAELAYALLKPTGGVVHAETLKQRVWGHQERSDGLLLVCICKLRKAIKGGPVAITNIYGRGYILHWKGN